MATRYKMVDVIPVVEEVVSEVNAEFNVPDGWPLDYSRISSSQRQHDYISALVEKIASTISEAEVGRNPLQNLLRAAGEYGRTAELAHVNPAKRVAYDPFNSHGELSYDSVYQPDVVSVYLPLNRGKLGHGDSYPVDIPTDDVRKAFTSAERLFRFVEAASASIPARKRVDDFSYMRAAINKPVQDGRFLQHSLAAAPSTRADYENLIAAFKTYMLVWQETSNKYNPYALFDASKISQTSTSPDELRLICRADILANISVKQLANVMQKDESEIPAAVYPVSAFDDPSIIALLCDARYCSFEERIFEVTSHIADRGRMLHLTGFCDGAYNTAPVYNAVYFKIDAAAVPVTAASIAASSPTWDGTAANTVTVTLTPNAARFVGASVSAAFEDSTAPAGLVVSGVTLNANKATVSLTFDTAANATLWQQSEKPLNVTLVYSTTGNVSPMTNTAQVLPVVPQP